MAKPVSWMTWLLLLFFHHNSAFAQPLSEAGDGKENLSFLSERVIYGQNLDEQIYSAQIQTEQSAANFDKPNYLHGVAKLALLYEIKGYKDSALYLAERALSLLTDSFNHITVKMLGTALRSSGNKTDVDKPNRYLALLNSCEKKNPSLAAEISRQKAHYFLLTQHYNAFSDEILALEFRKKEGHSAGIERYTLWLKGKFLLEIGEIEPASQAIEKLISSLPEDSLNVMYMHAQLARADLLSKRKLWAEASAGYLYVIQRIQKLGASGDYTQVLISLAHSELEQNKYLSAESLLYEAQNAVNEAKGQLIHLQGQILSMQAQLQLALFKNEKAAQLGLEALFIANASGNKLEAYHMYNFMALISEKTSHFDQALNYRKSSEKLSKEINLVGAYAYYDSKYEAYSITSSPAFQSNGIKKSSHFNLLHAHPDFVLLGALILFLFTIAFLSVRNLLKQKSNKELQKKNQVIVSQNKELLLTNEQLNEAKMRAEAASVAKSNFLAITSHEIRTPLNGIMGMASLLSETQLDPAQKNYVETIVKSSENLLIILNDILDFSKLESGKLSLEVKLIDLERLLDEVRTIFAKQAQERNITITRKIGNAGIKFFRGDILRIRQVLINLVSNAVKFTENGTVKIIVDLEELHKEGDDDHNRNAILRFSVQDDGIGISPEKQQIIFESFEQEDSSTSRKFGGIGLGLSISKKLVELMGGSIGLQSQKNIGTTFYFSLPVIIPDITNKLNEEPVNAAIRDEEAALKDIPLSERYPMRIVLAEDNMFNKLFIEKLLEKFGYEEFSHADNGNQVMEILEKEMVDLILMDIQMPGKDGIETTKEIIAKYGEKRPVIVAVTADSNDSNKEFYLNAGMDAFLSKPFKEKDLKGILEKYGQRLNSGKNSFKRIIP